MLGAMRALLVAVLTSVCVAGCTPPLPYYEYAKEPDPRRQELVLGVGDSIGINVWDNAPFNTEATIRPDGTITMPLIGDLQAVGQTPTSLRDQISKKLAAFVKLQGQGTDQITVAVRAYHSYRFTIAGEVARSGVFTSDQYVTVAEALAMAGGLSRFAKRNEVKLLRRDPKTGAQRTIPLDYDQLASGKRLDMNIFVLPGDSIYVP